MGYRGCVQEKDALLLGDQRNRSFYLPVALIDRLEELAVEAGYRSTGSYVVELLVWAVRQQERDRAAKAAGVTDDPRLKR